MRRLTDTSQLVRAAYEAAQDRAALPMLLNELAKVFRSTVTCMRVLDASSATPRYVVTNGIDSAELNALEAKTAPYNIWRLRGTPDILARGVSDSDSIVPIRELLGSAYYADMLRPLGVAHGLAFCLKEGPGKQLSTFTINRPMQVGRFTEDEIAYAKAALPHLRSAYAIMQRLSWVEQRASELERALDQVGVGVLLVDASGSMTYGNGLAEDVHRTGISSRIGKPVSCSDPCTSLQLREAISRCATGSLNGPAVIPVRSRTGRVSRIMVVTMLEPMMAHSRVVARSVACIFVHPADPAPIDPEATIRQVYGATRAEAAVAALLAADMSPSRCAEVLGLSRETVKSHMKRLFSKTCTRRQSSLVDALRTALRICA